METQTVTAHVPKDLVSKVDAMAMLLDRPRGWVVKQALADWVVMEEERHRLTLEGMASARAGIGVPHEEMIAWVETLGTGAVQPLPAARRIL
jgi:predicted transcriptional regulator